MSMKLYRLIVAVVVAILTAMLPAAAAETLVSPSWTSDQVRAARPIGPEDALIFDVREEKRGGQGQARITTSTVTLTQSSAQIVSGTNHGIDDYKLCRSFAWSDGKPVFQNINCYADPAFRFAELSNRLVLAGALAHANIASSALNPDPYWAEAELGVQQAPSDRLTVSRTNDGIEYHLKDEVVVRMAGSAAKLHDDEAWRVAGYFARHWPLHPQPRRDLEKGTNLPERVEIETKNMSGTQTEILTISNVRRNKVAYPLPSGLGSALRVAPDSGDGSMQRGVRQALLAIDGRSAIAKPTPQALLAQMHEAATQGHSVEVVLLFSELGQQYESWFISPKQRSVLAELRPLLQKSRVRPSGVDVRADPISFGKCPGRRRPASGGALSGRGDNNGSNAVRHVPVCHFREPGSRIARLIQMGPGHFQAYAAGSGRRLLDPHRRLPLVRQRLQGPGRHLHSRLQHAQRVAGLRSGA